MEGDAALGLSDKDTHMRSSGPGPKPFSVRAGGEGGRQDKTQGRVLRERGHCGQRGWEAS